MKRLLILVVFIGLLFSFTRFADPNRYFEITKNIELFTNIYKELNYYYVDDIEPGKLMKTGIDAMLNTLDPYTNYFSEAQVETYRFSTEGKYHSIGAGIRMVDDLPTAREIIKSYVQTFTPHVRVAASAAQALQILRQAAQDSP